jgi:hypothetical protein
MSALTIVQSVCSMLGVDVPVAAFSSTVAQVIQIRHLMNQEGIQLAASGPTDHAWTVLTKEKTFPASATEIQAGAIPPDFGWYINGTMRNRATAAKGYGPITPQEWQNYKGGGPGAGPLGFGFRFLGGDLLLYPAPNAGDTIAYEYVSTEWAKDPNTEAGKPQMTADIDISKLPENLLALGTLWRLLQAKGLDYAEPYRTYQIEIGKAIARDGGRQRYTLGTQRGLPPAPLVSISGGVPF